MIKPGMRERDLEDWVREYCEKRGLQSALEGYEGFPGFCCISRNEVAAHGYAGEFILKDGDVLSLDIALVHEGAYADAAWTFGVGKLGRAEQSLISVAWRAALQAALKVLEGKPLGDVTLAAYRIAEHFGYSIPPGCYGHGIGEALHMSPRIPFNPSDPLYIHSRELAIPRGISISVEPLVFWSKPSESRELINRRGRLFTPNGEKAAQFEFNVWTGNVTEQARVLSLPGIDPYDRKIQSSAPF